MYISNEFVRRTFYSLGLKHRIYKDHIDTRFSPAKFYESGKDEFHILTHLMEAL